MAKSKKKTSSAPVSSKFPKYNLEKSLRVPAAILEQNAGKNCTPALAASFISVKHSSGPFVAELSSAIKFGLLKRQDGELAITEVSRQILKPKNSSDANHGLQLAILSAPVVADVYNHFRGENLPDEPFFTNTLVESFNVPQERIGEFKEMFLSSLRHAHLIEEHNGKLRIIDAIKSTTGDESDKSPHFKKLEKSVQVSEGDTCFVMMPFALPVGGYYEQIYEPAIAKAGLKPVRADDDIFKTGKIMEQISSGILMAKVLVAELTGRNPNVFYELGLAHALKKPVVLVASNEADVPFDVRHIRVIYYDVNDPFWGEKLIAKVSENVLSAIKNPKEATFQGFEEK